mmetsp:Transcript_41356/g.117483  ORF Transcript_41356/g.117483 Transcript_41356/m.117483 type:complete len:125 (-) Transcript_41356:1358-1732(-)
MIVCRWLLPPPTAPPTHACAHRRWCCGVEDLTSDRTTNVQREAKSIHETTPSLPPASIYRQHAPPLSLYDHCKYAKGTSQHQRAVQTRKTRTDDPTLRHSCRRWSAGPWRAERPHLCMMQVKGA